MAEVITDAQVAAVLRPFVRASRPVLGALRESDPLGLVRRILPATHRPEAEVTSEADRSDVVALRSVRRGVRERVLDGLESVQVPGTAAWQRMSVRDRTNWWVNRVGRVTVLVAAIPGIGGALADRLPIQDTLAVAGQGLLLCAIAVEHGVTDQAEQVRLLAKVLFDRTLSVEVARGERGAGEDEATAALTEDLDGAKSAHGRFTLTALGRTLWKFGRTLWALGGELDKRPKGRFFHRVLGMLPVVGLFADYLGERSALKRAARQAVKWLGRAPVAGAQYR